MTIAPLRRGGVLLEIVISMSIFVGAAAFTLAATNDALRTLERVQREQEAVDLARSKMAELELGLISLADLRGTLYDGVGTYEADEPLAGATAPQATWRFDVETERSPYSGLTLVALTVSEEPGAARTGLGFGAEPDRVTSSTLRRLIRLRGEDRQEYEQDELMQGLPEAAP